jgi:hypothetical protein
MEHRQGWVRTLLNSRRVLAQAAFGQILTFQRNCPWCVGNFVRVFANGWIDAGTERILIALITRAICHTRQVNQTAVRDDSRCSMNLTAQVANFELRRRSLPCNTSSESSSALLRNRMGHSSIQRQVHLAHRRLPTICSQYWRSVSHVILLVNENFH